MGRGYNVAKAFECFVVEWVWGYVDLAIVVVSVNVDFDIFCSFGVHRDIAVVLESEHQVVGINVGGIFDTKIVDSESELDRT